MSRSEVQNPRTLLMARAIEEGDPLGFPGFGPLALCCTQDGVLYMALTALSDNGTEELETANNQSMSNTIVSGVLLVTGPAQWSENDAPAAAAAASATRAAQGSGRRNVCENIICTLTSDATGPSGIIEYRLRLGAGGTIVWRGKLSIPASSSASIVVNDLAITGGSNQALVLESDAPAAGNEATVSFHGYTVT